MKKVNILSALFMMLFISSQSYALGTHNFIFSVAGGMKAAGTSPTDYAKDNNLGIQPSNYIGVNGLISFGYLYQNYNNPLGHSLDFKANFQLGLDVLAREGESQVSYSKGDSAGFVNSGGHLSLVYGLGSSFNTGRYSVDIVGINFGFGSYRSFVKFGDMSAYGDKEGALMTGLNLPFGVSVYLNNGFYFGTRHSINLYTPLYSMDTRNDYNNGSGANVFTTVNDKNTRNLYDYQINVMFGATYGK